MIRPGSSRTAFPTESRKVAGADEGYKFHILAYCRNCPAEGAIMIPNSAGSVPPEVGVKMFRRLNWKMGSSRNKDTCPACASRSKIAAAPRDKRTEVIEKLNADMNLRVALDPAYTEQKEWEALYLDFPLLMAGMLVIADEYAAEGRVLPDKPRQRADILLQAALKRARRDSLMDEEMIQEIEGRIAELQELMIEIEERAAVLNPLMEQANASLLPPPKPSKKEQDMNLQSGRPATAMADAFIKAQTTKIKQDGQDRAAQRTPQEQAALDKLIDDQKRDATRGLRLVGKKRPAPLPPMKSAKPALAVAPTKPEPVAATPPVKKAPNRVKRTGGWDDMTPEQHAERTAKMTLKRNQTLAAKAGLPFDEWNRRNEARKAEDAARKAARDSKKALKASAATPDMFTPAPAPVAPTPIAETPMPAKPAPQAIHDNTTAPTAAGIMDRIKIAEALEQHYVRTTSAGEGGYYRGDFSDKALAETLNVPQAWIAERREAMLFGEDVNENTSKDAEEIAALVQEINTLKAAQNRLFDDGANEVSQIEARQAALMERIAQDTKKLLDAASEKVADEVARIETRVSEVDRRIAALAERR